MKSSLHPSSRFILAAALVCSALPVVSQGTPTTDARFDSYLSGSLLGYGIVATPADLSNSHQVTGISDSKHDGSMLAESFASAGAVGANAHVDFHGTNSNSGSLRARASARWWDIIDVIVPPEFTVPNLYYWELVYQLGANGGVGASGTNDANGYPLASGSAGIGYHFVFGQTVRDGYQTYDAGVISSPSSTWGTLSGTTQALAGDGIFLDMSGYADAAVGNAFNFGERSAAADAVFGNTLIWQGIAGVRAYDASHQEILLPDDFHLDLIGRNSGFNYWNAAVHPNAPAGVPDSGSAALMLAPALLGLALARCRQRMAAGS